MNKKIAGIISVLFIVICLGYIIYDLASGRSEQVTKTEEIDTLPEIESKWSIVNSFKVDYGDLNAVVVSSENKIIVGGNSFLACYTDSFSLEWIKELEEPVFALTEYDEVIYAAGKEEILIFNKDGELEDRWGPYDDGAVLTGLSANKNYLAIADAGNKLVFVTDKNGALKSIIGYPGNQLIIPSAYFDVKLTAEDILLLANTGNRSIEFRTIKGDIINAIGDEGDELENFCGCCNPAHFDLLPDGSIITAEKGINRIKILNPDGSLIEPVAQPAHFMPSIPIDISVSNSGLVYGANRKDSKIYVFKRNK